MRNVYRGLVAGVIGLPLAFGAPGVALAGDYDQGGDKGGGHHKSDKDHRGSDKDHRGSDKDHRGSDKDHREKAVDGSRPSTEQVQGQENTGKQEQETEQTNNSKFRIYQFVFGGEGDPMQMVTPTATNESSDEQTQGFGQGQLSEQGQDVAQDSFNSKNSDGSTDSATSEGSGTKEASAQEQGMQQAETSAQGQGAEKGQATEK